MSKRDFLLEIGTEELPPGSLLELAQALSDGIVQGLDAAAVPHGDAKWYATPRRLAVHVAAVADRQPDQQIRRTGPAVANAFDRDGAPTKAALGFAASCGVAVEQLERAEGPKGPILQYVGSRTGESTVVLLPAIATAAVSALPIARRMRWGAGNQEFVRPVHWIVMLFGAAVVEGEILGVRADKHTRGHRFHAPRKIAISNPARYCETLLSKGYVVADIVQRRERIRAGVAALAESIGGRAVIGEALLDEVTALVEWPVPLAGRFDEKFLALPEEIPIAAMQDHQRYFPVREPGGSLMNAFITVANIDSRDPDKVRDGNQRVVRPRLADATFFWERDRREPLAARREALRSVSFQQKLGSLFDKSQRVVVLAARIAQAIGGDEIAARRAAELSKCDLLTAMVGEFPELQGLMGKYYASHDGEPDEVCVALEEQYWPRFSGDRLPQSQAGIAVALADKLDTLAGIFCIGQKPTGARDPFALRRAALGVLRIAIERKLELDLRQLVEMSVSSQPVQAPEGAVEDVWSYLMERLRSLYLEESAPRVITTEMFDAVLATKPHSPLDIDLRLRALGSFLTLPASTSLASANKRIANILRKASGDISAAVDTDRLEHAAERQLFEHVLSMERAVNPLVSRREYGQALTRLSSLRDDVDGFFDNVMVMAEDPDVRTNRLGLLTRLRGLFLQVADLSRLPG
ncbi:MAG: glycine--tRNA ligase subunit beta [Steroidobacter sp.]